MTAIKLITETKLIDKAIASIANRGKKLDSDIQLAALSVINHIDMHGDVTLANRLFDALPKGARRLALAEWFLAFGKLAANTDKATAKTGVHFLYAKDKKTDLVGATETPWYEMKKEADVISAFDVQAELARLLAKIKKAQKDGVELKNADKLAALLALETK